MADELKIIKPGESGQVALPLNEEQFKDFIVSLLGKPQTISKGFNGDFELSKDNIIALHQILDQRILQQNDAKLIQFRATIYYDDNSTTTLTGLDHLLHYNESLPIVSQAIHLTWQYLIKFRDKSSYEKQEISVSFLTPTDEPIMIDGENRHHHQFSVSLRIQHTARTWGADIEGILSKHIKTIIQKESAISRFFRYDAEALQSIIGAFLILISLSFSIYSTYKFRKHPSLEGDQVFWIHHYGGLMFLFGVTLIIIRVTNAILEHWYVFQKPSFILLTSESIKEKTKSLASYKQNWWRHILTIIGSLTVGVISNILYTYISK